MNVGALYAELLDRPAAAEARHEDGRLSPLPVARWLGATTDADELVAASVEGPVLDVGCGPGRLLDALARNDTWALGVDLSPAAVGHARARGRRAVLGCIFSDVPGAGQWESALLLDGNLGIGGDPSSLLARVRALLRPGGTIVAELDPPGMPTGRGRIRIETDRIVSEWFDWGHVGADGIGAVASAAGLAVTKLIETEGRWFAWLS